ncbi:ShlB/FhaC/HecB family hemolysin secretion/activation protein [Trinickia violacea]|uniref:ShlB/FhaC/HecB family hemolysin secretion/activation protein n=1 Tax=Trinickia violacea TaxID=2571746 RepID=A0A4P8IP03_9BURK|nr:ShlB/FhaC/HecB family hemolysin secretion/activation protein [Trinickia violacea]QCP50036.1 ShlB/FhaC/HecB family hemolysin secretion/activation protein [Trinickia violacea]
MTVRYKGLVYGAILAFAIDYFAAPSSAWADSPLNLNDLQRQNDVILRQQQNQLRQDQSNAERPGRTGGATLTPPAPVTVPETGPCRDIKAIVVNGATHLPKGTLDKLVHAYEGRCLRANDIEALLTEITAEYFRRAYITTHAYLPAQDLTTGQLTITVVEGRIQAYRIEDNPHNRLWANAIFPAVPGAMLNLRDLEQGIDQINRATSNNARLDIEPGSQPGESVVVVHNPQSFPLHLFTSYDNQSVDATGRLSGMATVTEDGLLGLNEIVSVTHRQTLPFDSAHDSKTDALDVVIPFGYNTLTFDLSDMRYDSLVNEASGTPLLSQGSTITRSIGLDRVVFRNQDSKVSVSASLTDQSTSSYLQHQFLSVASRELTFLDLGTSLFAGVGGGLFNGRFDFVQGLPILGSLRDPGEVPDSAPHAQFSKVTLDLGYTRPFSLFGRNLDWSSHLDAQYAMTTLFGSQQILLGGPTTVRGFLDETLSGDTGAYWRNEIGVPFSLSGQLGTLSGRFYTGFDAGSVTNRAPGVPGGTMTGLTVGASWQWRRVSGEVYFSHPLTMPNSIAREANRVFFRLSYSL